MAFCTPEGGNGTRGEAEGAISPRGCTKPMDPSHRVQQLFCYTFVKLLFLFSKFCCHLQTLLRQTIHCLISRLTRNNSLEPAVVSYTALEIDQRWERSRWSASVYITFHVTRPVEPCNMRFCCASHDLFSTNQTSQFVQRYNNDQWCIVS